MENGGSSSCWMGFEENVSGGTGMSSMMMPSMSSSPFTTHYNSCSNPNTSTTPNQRCYYLDKNILDSDSGSIKAKIMSHPYYPRLLAAYIGCHKIGAPPEVVVKLEEAYASGEAMHRTGRKIGFGQDPPLDQFMEAYCEMLTKYEHELTKPFKEAMMFLSRMEGQVQALTASSSNAGYQGAADLNGISEEDVDGNVNCIDPQTEDTELKFKLLRRYGGSLIGLKQGFLKKKKKIKLPKEARQQLLEWWTRHNRWPYPNEAQKLELAAATGLDQKQINNWFINQRKRHWKPPEDPYRAAMDGMQPHCYMNAMLSNQLAMDCNPSLL